MASRVVVSLDDAIVTEVELTKPVTVVGRHPACDIVIDHPAVSGRHMLFRVVNRTVYAEDLASTNGVRVNGLALAHQVVHHLDLLEVGRHKLHFFDGELLARVDSLESTFQTDYERTMLAANVAEARSPAETAVVNRGEQDLSRTQYIPRDPSLRLGPAQEAVRTEDVGAPALALKILAGGRPGELVSLNRPNTMIGAAGADTALVIKRGRSFFLARLSGSRPPRLNRKELGPGTHPIAPQDVIDVGGWSFEVIQAAG
ncbi:MAG TPA: FHA domain-containing protein [Usitatibacter sp.]|nr:FHA domain-containing protein [Usitatibacter sp.]